MDASELKGETLEREVRRVLNLSPGWDIMDMQTLLNHLKDMPHVVIIGMTHNAETGSGWMCTIKTGDSPLSVVGQANECPAHAVARAALCMMRRFEEAVEVSELATGTLTYTGPLGAVHCAVCHVPHGRHANSCPQTPKTGRLPSGPLSPHIRDETLAPPLDTMSDYSVRAAPVQDGVDWKEFGGTVGEKGIVFSPEFRQDLRESLVAAMGGAWSDYISDEGNYPECLQIELRGGALFGGKIFVTADFSKSNFVQFVANLLMQDHAHLLRQEQTITIKPPTFFVNNQVASDEQVLAAVGRAIARRPQLTGESFGG